MCISGSDEYLSFAPCSFFYAHGYGHFILYVKKPYLGVNFFGSTLSV